MCGVLSYTAWCMAKVGGVLQSEVNHLPQFDAPRKTKHVAQKTYTTGICQNPVYRTPTKMNFLT